MRFVMFCQSLASDWNHGNAHFLRGLCTELKAAGHDVRIFEPADSWSRSNLEADEGPDASSAYLSVYPDLVSERFDLAGLDVDQALDGADVVLVHEWNSRDLVRQVGVHRLRSGSYALLFHDTHHRAVTDPTGMAQYDLSGYDGVLAFGRSLADEYERRGWARRTWVLHEAADARVFRPLQRECEGDVVWVGNWGDDERTAELEEFLVRPVADLGLKTRIYGVRYPAEALARLAAAPISYAGYLPNFRVPEVFARYRMTVHVPRGPYARTLPGVPTIRMFEALACGIPLVSAPWDDAEHLFRPGEDYLVARNGKEMTQHLRDLSGDGQLAAQLAAAGLRTVQSRHTCAHRAMDLLAIVSQLRHEVSLELGAAR